MPIKKVWNYVIEVKKRICIKEGEIIFIIKKGERRGI